MSYRKHRNDFEATIHGYEPADADGGAAGSGLASSGSGTSAWQMSLKMNLESNVKNRRN